MSGLGVDQASFYDDIAEYYDLIYADWGESMRCHAAAISSLVGRVPGHARILDVSAGIGTEALPLASRGCEVVARDLSPGAIRRLKREATERGLHIDASTADMSEVARSVSGTFDAVICFDNSLPHLLSDDEISATLRGLVTLPAPGGVLLISVRNYDEVDRSPISLHRYDERTRAGSRYRMSQEWRWYNESHYQTTMRVEQVDEGGWREVVRTAAAYYAIPVPRLLELMRQAGLNAEIVEGLQFFQPVLRGSAV